MADLSRLPALPFLFRNFINFFTVFSSYTLALQKHSFYLIKAYLLRLKACLLRCKKYAFAIYCKSIRYESVMAYIANKINLHLMMA